MGIPYQTSQDSFLRFFFIRIITHDPKVELYVQMDDDVDWILVARQTYPHLFQVIYEEKSNHKRSRDREKWKEKQREGEENVRRTHHDYFDRSINWQ